MKKSTELITGGALMLTYAAFTGWLFCLSVIQNHCTDMHLRPVLPALYLLAVYAVDCALSGRGASLSLYVGLQLLFAGAGFALFQFSVALAPGGLGTRILLGVIYACGAFTAGFAAPERIRQQTLIFCFDTLVIMAVILLLLAHFLTLPALTPALGACFAAMGAALAAMIVCRVGKDGLPSAARGSAGAGRALLIALLALAGGVSALLVALAAGALEGLSAALVRFGTWSAGVVKRAVLLVMGLIERVLLWLSRFTDDVPVEAGPGFAGTAAEETTLEGISMDVPAWVYAAAGIIIAALLVLLLFHLRLERVTGKKTLRRRHYAAVQKRENGLFQALRRLFAALAGKVRYRLACVRYRRTAAGLLAWCERRAPREKRRRRGESPGQFLTRLSGEVSGAESAGALTTLAALAERAFYSPAPVPVPPELYRAVRRCRFGAAQD